MSFSQTLYHAHRLLSGKCWHVAACFISCIFLAGSTESLAQNELAIIPPSPTATALAEYADVPVNMYSGLPSINIPIWTMTGQKLQVPISLSYHAGGVKVEENASWVGLGWSLNAGGVITRTARGVADEDAYGYINQTSIPEEPRMDDELEFVLRREADYEPDVFFFNVNGLSGKFVFNRAQNKFVPLSESDIEIIYTTAASAITSFTIKAEDGTVYTFSHTEQNRTTTSSWDDGILQSQSLSVATTSWYLSSITTPQHTETITFNYTTEQYRYRGPRTGRNGYRANGEKEYETQTQAEYEIIGTRLTSIESPQNKIRVEFIADQNRDDILQISGLPDAEKAKRLSKIQIVNTENSAIVRTFVLDNDQYFVNSQVSSAATDEQYLYRRLKLDEVREWDGAETVAKQPYRFSYDESIELPPKDAHTQDHWGYFNGIFTDGQYYSMNYMVPQYKGRVNDVNDQLIVRCNGEEKPYELPILDYVSVNGDSRKPSYPAMQAGTLTTIKYPTGGTTTFSYEPHEYSFVGNKDYQKTQHQMGDFMAEVGKYDGGGNDQTVQSTTFIPALVENRNQVIPLFFEIEQIFASIDAKSELEPNDEAVTRNEFTLREALSGKNIFRIYLTTDVDGDKVFLEKYRRDSNIHVTTEIAPVTVDAVYDSQQGINIMTALYASSVQTPTLIELEAGTEYVLEARRRLSNNSTYTSYTITNESIVLASLDGIALQGNETVITNHQAGGLRVKQKTVDARNDAIPMVTHYTYKVHDQQGNETEQSSGALLALPKHYYSRMFEDRQGGGACPGGCGVITGVGNGCYQDQVFAYTVLEGHAGYHVPLSTTQGSFIGYDQVKVHQAGAGYTVYQYHSPLDYDDQFPTSLFYTANESVLEAKNFITNNQGLQEHLTPFIASQSVDWKRGLLEYKVDYNEQGTALQQQYYNYTLINQAKSNGIAVFANDVLTVTGGINVDWAEYTKYQIVGGFQKLVNTTTIVTDPSDLSRRLTTTTNYFYDLANHHQVARTETTDSRGLQQSTMFQYAANFNDTQYGSDLLRANHMYKQVLEQTTLVGGQPTQKVTTTYLDQSGFVVPDIIAQYPTGTSEAVLTKYDFNDQGNVKQVQGRDGIPIAYIWGYQHSLPVAQVVGVEHDQAVSLSNLDLTALQSMNNDALRDELNKLRNLEGALVTTYTYERLTGMTSVTDPTGTTLHYHYDPLKRLYQIKDYDDRNLTEYQYQYRTTQ